MISLIVNIRVRPEAIEAWKSATLDNVEASRKEKGILAFDLLEDRDDPTRFVLVEEYRDEAAMASHKETEHYARWRETTEPLQAEPRTRAFYRRVGSRN
jgi:(4S)-4-hydroxy-5-phosphonooxypentane-2,3-dione isomerase